MQQFLTRLAFLALVGLGTVLAGCAETNLAVEAAKVVTRPGEDQGPYKIGKPYSVKGVWYYPQIDFAYDETGVASWYGPGFNGQSTANGETYDENELTAAHKTLPMPTLVRVTNLENGRSIIVRINDRGPFANNRIIDMSRRGAQLLGFEQQGTAKVRVQVLREESMQLAAQASAHGGDAFSPPPTAAPAGSVQTQALPTAGATTTPGTPSGTASVTNVAASSAASAPTVKPTALGQVQIPALDGKVSVQPVTGSRIFIQAGAFLRAANAQKLTQKLSRFGQTRITQFTYNKQLFYRVQLGPIASVAEADRLLQQVIEAGHSDARITIN